MSFTNSASDSIRMSFASWTWQKLWQRLPVSQNFDFDMTRNDQEESMEEFVSSVNDSLRVLHEHGVQKYVIPSFSLRGRFIDEIQTSHVDRWMRWVTKHYVKRLDFQNLQLPLYKFPPAAFDVGSLVALSLYNCILKRDLIQEDTSSFRLKELELSYFDLNGLIIGDYLSRCPSLEKLKLHRCEKVEYLELLDFPKLRSLIISVDFYLKLLSTRLKQPVFKLLDILTKLDLEAVCGSNLEELELFTFCCSITDQNIKKFIRKFSCLEKLALGAECFKLADDEIKISSNRLKSLRLTGIIEQKNIITDAPNLVVYHREGKEIPPSVSFNSVKLGTHYQQLYKLPSLHTKWFIKL